MNLNWDLILGALAALATLAATSSAALSWAARNGERLGRLIARRIPGDSVERFILDFLKGLERGLEAEIQVEAAPKELNGVTEVKVRVAPGNYGRTRSR